MTVAAAVQAPAFTPAHQAKIVGASTLGTLFEWYDFYVYGSLATVIAAHFISGVNETTGFILALAGFAVGFLFRPLGALAFGRIGDRVGRKTTFMITLSIMGLATVVIGLIPDYSAIGIAAFVGLVALRILQGMAVGGEYAGAVTYVCEHAPKDRRGLHVAFLPASAMSGLLLSLMVIAAVRAAVGADAFAAWGWRLPFLVSAPLLAISVWVRLKLHESPVFQELKAAGEISKAPLAESFLRWRNLRLVLIALVAMAGQAVTFYGATFYSLYFLQKAAKVDTLEASLLVGAALAVGALICLATGWLSDRVGRKPVLLCGFAAAALLFIPLFQALAPAANPALAQALVASPIIVTADRATCSPQFDPLGRNRFEGASCDIAVSFLTDAGASYALRDAHSGEPANIQAGAVSIAAPDPRLLPADALRPAIAAFRSRARTLLARAGYGTAEPADINPALTVALLALLMGIAALVTVPIHTILPELFPARVRYSSLALPQNVGNGVFGGFLPAVAFAIVAATGDIYAGLWYPVAIAATAFIICLLFLPETRGRAV
jgi:MFS family permease